LKISYTKFETNREELYGNYKRPKETKYPALPHLLLGKPKDTNIPALPHPLLIVSIMSTIGPSLAFYRRILKSLLHSSASFITLVSVNQRNKKEERSYLKYLML
jgi:hypothetical protein